MSERQSASQFVSWRTQFLASSRLVTSIGCLTAVAACSDLFNVGPNNVSVPGQFDNASGAILRRNQAVADFQIAQANQVLFSDLVSDQLTAYAGDFVPVDALHITGDIQGPAYYYPYGQLISARLESLEAIQTLEQYAPRSPSRIGQLFAFAGLVELYFAEDMCSGIPLATIANDLPIGVTVVSHDSLIAASLMHFDSALKYDADSGGVVNDSLRYLAQVSSGRALLYAGRVADAASAVKGVPESFVYVNSGFDGVNYINSIYTNTSSTFPFVSVANREGQNGLDYLSGNDPRVSVIANGTPDGVDTLYSPALYATSTAPVILASGLEASLIRAEAGLIAGQVQAWADTLNVLRTQVNGLQPLGADSTTSASGSDQISTMFRERAFWLFLTGHRQGDLRRLVRQYGRPVNSVFPTGRYPRPGATAYGTDVTFIPVNESNNTSFHGCIDRTP